MKTRKPRTPKQMLEDQLIVKHMAGSRAYGTNLPSSDIDIRGVFCVDELYIRSPWLTCGEYTESNEEDTKYYELVKFLKLVVDQNPNIIETLWVDDEDIIETSPAYQLLRDHRDDLLSSKCAFTFSGYAIAQLKRIKGHNKWINNPQSEQPPRQIDYMSLVQDFTDEKLFKVTGETMEQHRKGNRLVPYGNNIFGVYGDSNYELFDDKYLLNTVFEGERHGLDTPKRVVKFNNDVYTKDKDTHKNYWKWKRERNEARSELEEKYGYDTKHAMHLFRLLRMGKEILTEGEVRVKREDAKELLEIRSGKYSYDQVVGRAEEMDNEIKELYKTTELRRSVNTGKAAELLIGAQQLVWEKGD